MLEPFAEFIRFRYDYYRAHYYILLGRGQRTSGTALLEGRTRKNTKYKTKTQRNYTKHCNVQTNQIKVYVGASSDRIDKNPTCDMLLRTGVKMT